VLTQTISRPKPESRQQNGGIELYAVLLAIFIGSLVISQVLATKLAVWHLPLVGNLIFPAGVVAYALTYMCTDVIAEVWGRRRAANVVICGLVANLVALVLIKVALILPPAPFWGNEVSFTGVLGATYRVIAASIVAYLISQYHDVWMFHLLRRATGGRFLWLRNNISTILSQTIDTFVFIFLAFYGVAPILPLVIGQLVIKWLIAAIDTPAVYLLVGLIRRRIESITSGNN